MLNGFFALGQQELYREPCALLLGGFDGLHCGHASLLSAAKATGLPVGITSISGLKSGGDLFTPAERRIIFAEAGISFAAEYVFDAEFRATEDRDFLRALFQRINVKALYCGVDFRFGRGAEGTPELLKREAPCPVHVLPLTLVGGEKASVSRIKACIAAGDIGRANENLCGEFFLSGTVEHGRQVGRTYGFPTLNLSYPAEKFPMKEGVYGGTVLTPSGEYASVIHFGARPTFGLAERKLEAHLKDFSGDLYGATVRVKPKRFLREIKTFVSKEELTAQLKKDLDSV